MKSSATTVATYMEALPAERKAALVRLRKLCRETLKGYDEVMQFGMPCYQASGQTVVAFASQKQHFSIYVCRPTVIDDYRARLGKLNVGRGCIRFTKVEQMDFGLLQEILGSIGPPVAPSAA
jgi:uncharacterized protein YdhG (YjbR/CyaY superfamily)